MAILTVSELREHVTSELGADALQRLLDAAEAAIVARAGAPGARTEIVGGGYRFVSVFRPIGTLTSVKEVVGNTETTLAADDYIVRHGDMLIERRGYGTNPRSRWASRVVIAYTPVDDTALRETVQIDLVKLAITQERGLTSQTIGSWSEQYANNSAWNAEAERESILSRLDVGTGMVVV